MNRLGRVKGQISVQKQVDIYLKTHSHLELLRLVTCGSVGGGKSALIERILHDAQWMFEDQVTAPQQASKQVGTQGEAMDSVALDGLAPEREQGVTLDVAYRFFNTDRRKFIIADTPGHEQYIRNMVTGAATADVAVLLIDASQGIVTQTRRHSLITSLLGIRHLVLAVNKMDRVGFKQKIFDSIVASYRGFAKQLNFTTLTAIPLSALGGDNVTGRSNQTSWYEGQTLLEFLETVAVRQAQLNDPFCFPVQQVNRSSSEARGYVGTVISGSINKDQEVCVLPSGQVALVADILLNDECLDSAVADQAVTITLNKDVDISSGDILVTPNSPWEVSDQFEVSVVWMHANPGFVGRAYRMIIGTQDVNATITNIKYKYNINTFEHLSSKALRLNEIGKITLSLDKPVVFEPYAVCRAMGAFVLMDSYSQVSVGAGMINFALRRAQNVHWQALEVNKSARARLNGHPGKVIWFTGLSGSGKSTIASALEQKLHNEGIHTYILDGDNVRHGLNKDLGFTDADRIENIRRIAEVAKLMVDAGIVVLTAFISPFRSERDMARSLFEADEFVEIHVSLPLEIAEQRDPKGLYKKARRGDLPHFTGIDSVYEAPMQPDLKLETADLEIDDCVALVIRLMDKMRWI